MSNLITLNNQDNIDFNNLNKLTRQKMIFIYNSIENGWSITKCDDKYIFCKKHHNNPDVITEQFVKTFIEQNIYVNCD